MGGAKTISITDLVTCGWINKLSEKHVHNEEVSNKIRILEDLYKIEAIDRETYAKILIRLGEIHLS